MLYCIMCFRAIKQGGCVQDEELSFQWFERGAAPRTTRPRVGIQTRGNFSLNRAAYEGLGEPTHVKLGFDEARQVIGIKAAGPDEPNAYPVRRQPRAANYIFSGQAFTSHYGIPTEQARRYWGNIVGDVLVVDLTQEPDETPWPPKERDEYGRIRDEA
jgi:hypothetical protein